MPRASRRIQYLRKLRVLYNERMVKRLYREALDEDKPHENALDEAVFFRWRKFIKPRYIFRSSKYRIRNPEEIFGNDLVEISTPANGDDLLPPLRLLG